MKKFAPIIADFPHLLHGGDYNPDQWLATRPEVIFEDIGLMKLAKCNTFSVGIFSWSAIEPEAGIYTFEWLDKVMDNMAAAGNKIFLATPSGAKPAWLSENYPEIRRVNRDGVRDGYEGRHNNCNSSQIYRKYVRNINRRLAERYAKHPALAGFHVSNEYNAGDCYCDLCINAFHEYLKIKFGSLDEFNKRMWSNFWNHKFSSWRQIDPRDYYTLDGMVLEWKRFCTALQVDFMKNEVKALREYSDKPVTTNMMGFHNTIDYWRINDVCDFVADDCYPVWPNPNKIMESAENLIMRHDMHRSMKQGRPFLMMESTPSTVNWAASSRLKRPGMHQLEMLLAIGHGADGAMYFQWRKGRGGLEKFHGAVVSHDFGSDTRVFREVANVGNILNKLDAVVGTTVEARVAVIYDWEVSWAINCSQGLTDRRNYNGEVERHYMALRRNQVAADVIESSCDFSKYQVLVAPMLYLYKDGVSERLRKFVANGGILLSTYLSGYVNTDNMCYLNGTPGGGMSEVFGVRVEEFDGFTAEDSQAINYSSTNSLNLTGSAKVIDFAERFRVEKTVEILASYGKDFYAGEAAVTAHKFGDGTAYYLGMRLEVDELTKFYRGVLQRHQVAALVENPASVSEKFHISVRTDFENDYCFLFNFGAEALPVVELPAGEYYDMINDKPISSKVELGGFGSAILKRKHLN